MYERLAEQIVAVFATAGLGHLGGELAKGALGAERVATRAGQFVQHASSELMSQACAMATKGAFSETGLTGGDLSATAISGFARVLGAGTTGVLKAGLAHGASLAAKLAANVRAHLVGGTVTSLGGLAGERPSAALATRLPPRSPRWAASELPRLRGTVTGLKDSAAELAAEQREAARHRVADLGAEPETAPAPTHPRAGYGGYPRDRSSTIRRHGYHPSSTQPATAAHFTGYRGGGGVHQVADANGRRHRAASGRVGDLRSRAPRALDSG